MSTNNGFKQGHAPLQGCGRPVGSRNGNTILRDYFRGATIDLFPDFLETLTSVKQTDPKTFMEYYIKMSERVLPRLQNVSFTDDEQTSSAMSHLRDIAASWTIPKQPTTPNPEPPTAPQTTE